VDHSRRRADAQRYAGPGRGQRGRARIARHRPAFLLSTLALLVFGAGEAVAQQLTLKREVPPVAWSGCPPLEDTAQPTSEERAEAARLATEATQAALLGDDDEAHRLLEQAVSLDPTSSELAYRLALTLEQRQRPREAVAAYCRYVQLDAAAPDATEVLDRLPELMASAGFSVPAAAADAFVRGVAAFDAGRLDEADVAFAQAWRSETAWGTPLYNRAVVRFAAGRSTAAVEDLRQYLELSPGAEDFHQVLDIIVSFHEGLQPRYSVGGAFVTGLLVPGLGHFTTGRPVVGALVLGSAGGALAAGFGVRRVEIACASPVQDGECPPDQVLGRSTERPYQMAGIAAAAAIGFLGALDAARGASRRNDVRRDLPRPVTRGASLDAPAIRSVPDGVRLDFVRIRF
jgi:tetratricopeptide (TPR) repeat protein